MGHSNYTSIWNQKYQPQGYRFVTGDYEIFHVIYVSSGELVFESDSYKKVLRGSELVILRKGSVFELSCPRKSYRGVAYQAIGKLPDAFCGPAEALFASKEIRTLAELMQAHFISPGEESEMVLKGLATSFAWECIRVSRNYPEQERGGQYWANIAKAAIDGALFTPMPTRKILQSIPMSYRQISRHFQEHYNQPIKTYQLMAKIEQAKELLDSTNMSITDIAMELGFASSQHFAMQFRKLTGQAASVYKKEH